MEGQMMLWKGTLAERRHRAGSRQRRRLTEWKLRREDVMHGPVPDFAPLGIR